jgi:hypothetical protein
MNDQLQQALLAILNATTSTVASGVNFLQAQLPDVIQQLLIWHAVESLVWFLLWPTLGAIGFYIARKMWVAGHKDDSLDYVACSVLLNLLSLAVVLCAFANLT